MKNVLKRLLSVILIASMVLSLTDVPASAASYSKRAAAFTKYIKDANELIRKKPIEDSTVTYAPPKHTTARSKLTAKQKKCYDIILKNARNVKEFGYGKMSDQKFDDMDTAWRAVTDDHPEYDNCLFYDDSCGPDGHIEYMRFYYKDFKGKKRLKTAKQRKKLKRDVAEYTKTFDKITDAIVKGMPKDASTIDKYRYFAIVLCYCTKYNYTAEEASIDDERLQTNEVMRKAWSTDAPLLYGKAVCEGYSKAYKYLCNKAGLYCETVSGLQRKNYAESHAWNLIKIESGTYYVDVTWMDNYKINTGGYYTYFLMTEKERDFKINYDGLKADGKKSYRNLLKKTFTTGKQLKGYYLVNNREGKTVKWSSSKKNDITIEIESYDLKLKDITFYDKTVLPASEYTCEDTELGIKVTIKGDSEYLAKGLEEGYNPLQFNFDYDSFTTLDIMASKK